jgi:hypothetical protein
MKKLVTILAMFAMVGTASATVRVFVTPYPTFDYGLENHANAFIPTISTSYANGDNENAYDYSDYYGAPGPIRPGTFPPGDAPSGTCEDPVEIPEGGFAYIWLQFQNEAKGVKINGLMVEISFCGTGVVPESVENPGPGQIYTNYYVCNNMGLPQPNKRWDGTATPPAYPEWHNNPQTMVAIVAFGLQNTAVAQLWNLWDPTNRIALLGAVAAPYDGSVYEINITNINYSSGEPGGLAGGAFKFLPEPASLLLLGLAGLLIRRR